MPVEFSPEERLISQRIDFTVEQMHLGKVRAMWDLDGSKVRTSLPAIDTFNYLNGTHYTERDMRDTWDMVRWAEKEGHPNPRDYAIRLWNSYKVMRWSPPVQGAVELARFLYEYRDYKIDIPSVTARPAATRGATFDWHDDWMPWASPENIFIQTGNDVNPHFKTSVIKEYEPDFYFEDQAADAESIVKATQNTTVILIFQYWNELYVVPPEYKGRIIKAEYRPWQSKVLRAFYEMVNLVAV